MKLVNKIEAILYLKGQPLSLGEIANLAGCAPSSAKKAILELMNDYGSRDSVLEVINTPGGYSLQLKSTCDSLLQNLIPAELGIASLRTLAAIALKSPLLQTELIELRGSSAYAHVQELVKLGLVRKRRQTDGRSYWLQVTDKFYQYFEIDRFSQSLS